jgi:N-acetylneuraminic acid mutarotase
MTIKLLIFHLLFQTLSALTPTYIPKTKTPPSPRVNSLLLFHDSESCLILFGGQSGSFFFSDLYNFSLSSNQWTSISPTSVNSPGIFYADGRSGSGGFIFEQKIFIFGGYGLNGLFNDLWEFDLKKLRWNIVKCDNKPPLMSFFGFDFGIIDDKHFFVVFGGKGLESVMNSIYL